MKNDPPRPLAIKLANFKKIWSGNHTLLVHIFSVADFCAARTGVTEFVFFVLISVCFEMFPLGKSWPIVLYYYDAPSKFLFSLRL